MSEPPRDADIMALENALAALTPLPAVVNRDRLMFQAGRASRQFWNWPWAAATAALALTAAGLGAALILRPAPPAEERLVIIHVREPAPSAPLAPANAPKGVEPGREEPSTAELEDQPPPSIPYYQLQNQLLRWGLDSLPALPPLPPPPNRDRPRDRTDGVDRLPLLFFFRAPRPVGDAS
jgi:hypothetical protein